MGVIFMIVGGVSRSKAGAAGIVSNSPVESVAIGIAVIGLLLFIMGVMIKFLDNSNTKNAVAKWALPASLVLSIILVIMSGFALGSKDLKASGMDTPAQKSAKSNLMWMFGVILALSLINVLVVGGVMKNGGIEGSIASRFGFDFEF
jgi:hypothetical protein